MASAHAPNTTTYAIGAGLLSGLLYGGIFGGDVGGLLFGYFAPLPLFAVGLACGAGAVVTASAFGALVALLLGGSFGVLFFVLVNAMPAVFLIHRVLLRDAAAPAGSGWYPVGRLLVLMSLVCSGVLGLFWLASIAVEPGPHEAIKQFVARMSDINEGAFRPSGDGADAGQEGFGGPGTYQAILSIFPGVVLGSWIVMVILNGVFAQALVRRFGTLLRPPPAMSDLVVPEWVSAAFTGALVTGILLPGPFDFLFSNLAVVLAIPCFFSGLAVVHAYSKRFEGRLAVLVGFYALMLLTVWPVALLVAIGVADPWLDLRQRLRPPDSGQET